MFQSITANLLYVSTSTYGITQTGKVKLSYIELLFILVVHGQLVFAMP